MEDLKTLISLLSVQKIKQIEILTEGAELSPKTKALYEAIRDGDINSDEEAAQLLYNTDEKNSAYRKLKYRLNQRLINTLFFIDVQEYSRSEYQKAYGKVMKNWAAFQILLDKGVKNTAVNLAESILKSALKYDMLEISFLVLKDLKFQYGLFIDNKYKYQKYSNQFVEISELLYIKIRSEDIYLILAREILNSNNYQYTTEIQQLEQEIEQIRANDKIYKSYNITYYILQSAYYVTIIKNDINEQLAISNTAIDYFLSMNHFSNIAIFSFTEKKGVALLGLNKYDEALDCFDKCLEYIPTKGGVAWHYIHNYLFAAYILQKKYDLAYDVISIIINNPGFIKLNESYREPWYLKEAFIHFLIKIGRITPSESDSNQLRAFRLSRFNNEVSKFSKDKRGLNITINIIQMLFLIIDEKYDAVLDKLTALRQYNFRYLKRPEYSRSSNFIKMLLKIPEGDYKAALIRKKAEKYYDELINNPSDFSEHTLSLEIIPYEQLWEEILSIFPE